MSVRTMARVWDASKHSGTELLVLLAIADFADDNGNAYPAVPTLAEKCRMSPRNANFILSALKASGELEVRSNEGPRGTNRYRIVLPGLEVVKRASPSKGSKPLKPTSPLTPEAGFTPEAPFTLKPTSSTPEAGFLKPLKPTSDEPSLNHQEPPVVARKHAARFDASQIDLPEWMDRSAWSEWVADRNERRKPITKRAAEQQIKALARYRDDGHRPAEVIAHSIANSYQGLFPPKTTGMAAGSSGDNTRPAWALSAGFANRFEAESSGCTERNAAQFRNGRRINTPRELV